MRTYISIADKPKKALVRLVLKSVSRHVVPGWVSEIHVGFVENMEDYAQVSCDYAYRRLNMELGPKFFSLPDDQQGRTLTHELAHALQTPLTEFVETMLLTPKMKANKAIMDLYTHALEASNDDTAEMLWMLMKK